MGRNDELAYSGSTKFAPLPTTRLYAEACAMKIKSDDDGGILKSVPIVKDEVVSLRRLKRTRSIGLLKRGGMLQRTKGGKDCCGASGGVLCKERSCGATELESIYKQ